MSITFSPGTASLCLITSTDLHRHQPLRPVPRQTKKSRTEGEPAAKRVLVLLRWHPGDRRQAREKRSQQHAAALAAAGTPGALAASRTTASNLSTTSSCLARMRTRTDRPRQWQLPLKNHAEASATPATPHLLPPPTTTPMPRPRAASHQPAPPPTGKSTTWK